MNTIPPDLAQQLIDFRQCHPERTWRSERHQWDYYRVGNPAHPCLVLLSHGGTDAEIMFPYITYFSTYFDVICPTIPATMNTVSETVAELASFLSALEISKTHLIGISFGGLLAQIFIRRYPDLIEHLILSHTVIPSQHLLELVNTQRAFIAFYPQFILRWLMQRSQLGAIATSKTPADREQHQFWTQYFRDWYRQHFTKRAFLARSRISADYHRQGAFKSDELKAWSGNLLIIESEYDEVISDGDRGALKVMYPRAYVQTLPFADHLAPLLASDEIARSMLNFLQKGDS